MVKLGFLLNSVLRIWRALSPKTRTKMMMMKTMMRMMMMWTLLPGVRVDADRRRVMVLVEGMAQVAAPGRHLNSRRLPTVVPPLMMPPKPQDPLVEVMMPLSRTQWQGAPS
jgi:hypothetical protein